MPVFCLSRPRIATAFFVLTVAIAAPGLGAWADIPVTQAAVKGLPTEKASPPSLPDIGLWMLAADGNVADWLEGPYQGKMLLEPINVIIVDAFATSSEEAAARLLAACGKAGFPQREGHSGGYSAMIGDAVLSQFPAGADDCFSDALFTFSNNHGRIFGPVEWKGTFVFTGAFSRESVDVVTKVKHLFQSFDRARDAFTQKMASKSEYQVSAFVPLGNAIIGDDALTTGDHDGVALLLRATR